ncbi:MAG TPA: M23 family peptidase [Rhodospirillaceae bacterium]|nr:M23 family peptidase [Rhodospirillaceae bacterium]
MLIGLVLLVAAGCRSTPDRGGPSAISSDAQSYTVSRGDSVYAISKKFGVRIRDIIETNGLRPPYRLQIGDRLEIPGRTRPASHIVRKGDTLYSISRQYNVSVSSLARTNRIRAPYRIAVGQKLRLPGAPQLASKASKKKRKKKQAKKRSKRSSKKKSKRKKRVAKAPELKAPPRTSSRFLWPVRGKVISKFGKKKGGLYNDGLNIAAAAGAPVRAAGTGVVAYGGNELAGFGNLILIKHSGNFVTAYAHNSVVLVKRGQKVRRGQIIAKVGKTGAVARPQLHFEIRKGRRPVNPLRHLVRRTASR